MPPEAGGKPVDAPRSLAATAQAVLSKLLLLVTVPAAGLAWAGAGHLMLLEAPGPKETSHLEVAEFQTMAGFAVLTSAIAAGSFWKLWRLQGRRSAFFVIVVCMMLGVSLGAAEIAARSRRPAWPAADLHGVVPLAGNEPWRGLEGEGASVETDGFSSNRWGQRDRERTLSPPSGLRRLALIGDSFLEESPGEPVSLALERRLDSSQWEAVNLGVSATAPDEYFYRLKHVALPLGCDACVMFVYLGNDLAGGPRTLESAGGITAVTPRQSALSDLGLSGLNHLLMNDRRPLLQAWFAAGDLAAGERSLHESIQKSSDVELAKLLTRRTGLPPQWSRPLMEKLLQPAMAAFYEMLRHPDGGRFRSYYLTDGLWLAGAGTPPIAEDRIEFAAHWVESSARLCASRQLPFLCVLIPDGFAVDPRLHEQWSPLADMRRLAEPTSRRGEELASRLTASGVAVLSLQEALRDVPGAYLNLDGHWSDVGVQRAADAVAKALAERFAIPLDSKVSRGVSAPAP